MCAMNGFIQAHGFGGWPCGRFQPVKGAIDEGGNGRFKGEPRKVVSAGIRGKELKCSSILLPSSFSFCHSRLHVLNFS